MRVLKAMLVIVFAMHLNISPSDTGTPLSFKFYFNEAHACPDPAVECIPVTGTPPPPYNPPPFPTFIGPPNAPQPNFGDLLGDENKKFEDVKTCKNRSTRQKQGCLDDAAEELAKAALVALGLAAIGGEAPAAIIMIAAAFDNDTAKNKCDADASIRETNCEST